MVVCFFIVLLTCEKCNRNNSPLDPVQPNDTTNTDVCMDTLESMNNEHSIMPLAVGNQWDYVTYWITDEGGIIEGLTDSLRTEITGDTIVNYEGLCYHVSLITTIYLPSSEARENSWYYWNGEDGLYSMGGISDYDTLIGKVLELKYPVVAGDSWAVPNLVYHIDDREFYYKDNQVFTCISTDAEFETPVGTFTCYKYHFRMSPAEDVLEDWDIYDYYVPGIGKVGQIIRSSLDNEIKWKSVLYSYKIN